VWEKVGEAGGVCLMRGTVPFDAVEKARDAGIITAGIIVGTLGVYE
jgi:hypothetical protein